MKMNISELWNNFEWTNRYVIGVWKRGNDRKIFEEITLFFPKFDESYKPIEPRNYTKPSTCAHTHSPKCEETRTKAHHQIAQKWK